MVKNSAHVDFGDKISDNVRLRKVNSSPTLTRRLTPRQTVDDNVLLVRRSLNNNFNNFGSTKVTSITLTLQQLTITKFF